MKTKSFQPRGIFRTPAAAILAVAILSFVLPQPAQAGGKNKNPGVIPHTPGTAKTYRALSAAWRDWQHGVIDETGFSPFSDDPTGVLCDVGQDGNYWFLAGAPADPDNPVVRSCTLPTGTFIYFPIINIAWITTSQDDADDIGDPDFFEFVDGLLYGAMTADDVTLDVKIDGRALGNLRDYFVQSSIFELPYYGSLDDGFLNFDYGYYLLLAPLSAGNHTIHVSGSFPFFGNTIAVDVTYALTVAGG